MQSRRVCCSFTVANFNLLVVARNISRVACRFFCKRRRRSRWLTSMTIYAKLWRPLGELNGYYGSGWIPDMPAWAEFVPLALGTVPSPLLSVWMVTFNIGSTRTAPLSQLQLVHGELYLQDLTARQLSLTASLEQSSCSPAFKADKQGSTSSQAYEETALMLASCRYDIPVRAINIIRSGGRYSYPWRC